MPNIIYLIIIYLINRLMGIYMEYIKYIDGGFSVIENLKVSGAREGKYGVTIIVSPNSTASAVFTNNKVVAAPVKYTKNVVKKGIVNKGQMKSFGENELPWKREYYVTYSTDANFVSYSALNFELYIHELIGVSGKIYDATQNYQYIEKMNDHTLNKVIELLWN